MIERKVTTYYAKIKSIVKFAKYIVNSKAVGQQITSDVFFL